LANKETSNDVGQVLQENEATYSFGPFDIEGTGMMATYISSTEILLKKTVAFHRNENE
jgi:hypothetical protein